MKSLSEYTHLFFDLDDTLTPSRSLVEPDMAELLASLPVDLVAVSGAANPQIRTQLPDLPLYCLGQNGNHAETPDGQLIWEKRLTEEEQYHTYTHISLLLAASPHDVEKPHDLIEDRKSQISYSVIGHTAPKAEKHAYDPDSLKRISLLNQFPLTAPQVEVRIGGTTCFDYFKVGSNKGPNVREFIAHMGWNANDCVYFGDKLMPGGNDETVIGIIDTIAVVNQRDTFEKLSAAFSPSDSDVVDKIRKALQA